MISSSQAKGLLLSALAAAPFAASQAQDFSSADASANSADHGASDQGAIYTGLAIGGKCNPSSEGTGLHGVIRAQSNK